MPDGVRRPSTLGQVVQGLGGQRGRGVGPVVRIGGDRIRADQSQLVDQRFLAGLLRSQPAPQTLGETLLRTGSTTIQALGEREERRAEVREREAVQQGISATLGQALTETDQQRRQQILASNPTLAGILAEQVAKSAFATPAEGPDQFEPVLGPQGNVIGQRNLSTGKTSASGLATPGTTKAPGTKAAFDTRANKGTGRLGFFTDQQIADSGGTIIPTAGAPEEPAPLGFAGTRSDAQNMRIIVAAREKERKGGTLTPREQDIVALATEGLRRGTIVGNEAGGFFRQPGINVGDVLGGVTRTPTTAPAIAPAPLGQPPGPQGGLQLTPQAPAAGVSEFGGPQVFTGQNQAGAALPSQAPPRQPQIAITRGVPSEGAPQAVTREPGRVERLTEPTRTPERAGKMALQEEALVASRQVRDAVINPQTNQIDRTLVATMFANLPFTEGRRIRSAFQVAAAAKLRGETGAVINESEMEDLEARMLPSPADNDETIRDKMRRMTTFFDSVIDKTDPDMARRLRERGGGAPQGAGPREQLEDAGRTLEQHFGLEPRAQ